MSSRSTLAALAVGALVLGGTGQSDAKSLYVVANLSTSQIQAYNINPTNGQITYQTSHSVTNYSGGAVDIAIDSDSGILFVVYEFSPTINILDGKTMKSIGTVNMPTTSARSAGIVYDHTRKRLYAAYRSKGQIFSYGWSASSKKLNYIGSYSLSGTSQTYGLDLDEAKGIIYVGGYNGTVNYYDVTKNMAKKGSMSVNQSGHKAVGVAVDASRRYLYSGGATSSGDQYFCQNHLDTGKIIKCVSGNVVRGVSVDRDTGYVYVTTYSGKKMTVYDSKLNVVQNTPSLGNPTGIVVPGKDVSYNPLNLTKSDGLNDAVDCVGAGKNIVYTISYSNKNSYKVTNAILTDQLPPQVTFISASGGGTNAGGKVTWKLGTINPGASGAVTLVVNVKTSTSAGTVIKNSGTLDTDQTPPTTQGDITNVCKSFCGDGKVNGGENCDTAIAAGKPGACPKTCNDKNPCTKDGLTGTACMVKCAFTPITKPAHNDGCCPPGSNSTNDNDCPKVCGNGLLEKGETCDPGIKSGKGKCPKIADCDDKDKCTLDQLSGGACTLKCTHTPVKANPAKKDGCCPKGHSAKTDADCLPPCGPDITKNCVKLCKDVKCPPGSICKWGKCVKTGTPGKDAGPPPESDAGVPIPKKDTGVTKTEAGTTIYHEASVSESDAGDDGESFTSGDGCACQTSGQLGSLPALMLMGLLLILARRRRS